MEFKDNLKALRKLHGYSQKELAEKLHYGSSTISNYESGHNQPSLEDLVRLTRVFSVSADCLLGIEDGVVDFVTWKTKYDKLSVVQKQQLVDFTEFISYKNTRR